LGLQLDRQQPLHFIGVGGIGMSALARILASRGFLVSGSDPRDNAVTSALGKAGVRIFHEQTAATLEPLFATNVWGVMYCVGEATRRMSTRHGGPGGAIVVISSAAARLGGLPGMVAYAASKGAVDSMTVGLAKELGGDGIRINAIRPGLIETDIIAHAGGAAFLERMAPMIPIGRAGQPIEIGEAAAWLLSPAASYVHGAILDVSGGR
jgi:NAD(P)-dependent dehydrogenase (short-subunit alcohol dehydrogenase family)